jgi:hypothetical protein
MRRREVAQPYVRQRLQLGGLGYLGRVRVDGRLRGWNGGLAAGAVRQLRDGPTGSDADLPGDLFMGQLGGVGRVHERERLYPGRHGLGDAGVRELQFGDADPGAAVHVGVRVGRVRDLGRVHRAKGVLGGNARGTERGLRQLRSGPSVANPAVRGELHVRYVERLDQLQWGRGVRAAGQRNARADVRRLQPRAAEQHAQLLVVVYLGRLEPMGHVRHQRVLARCHRYGLAGLWQLPARRAHALAALRRQLRLGYLGNLGLVLRPHLRRHLALL